MDAFLRAWPAVLVGTGLLILNLALMPRPRGTYLMANPWLISAQGTTSALAILGAAWIIWGAGRLTTRLAISACWLTVLLLLWQVLVPALRWPWIKYEQQLLTLGTWLGTIGLCAAAWRFGIRVIDPRGQVLGADPRLRQMSLLGLLALVSGTAIVLGVLRIYVPCDVAVWNPSMDDIFRWIAQIGGSLLVVSAVVTCFHVPRSPWLNLLLVCGFVSMIAALHLLAYGQSYRMYLLPPEPRLQIRAIHYVILTGWLLAAVGLLRCYGLRLRRVLPPEPLGDGAAPRLERLRRR